LAKGDYTQASEKLCGAPAEIVRAVAARRGIKLSAHKSLTKFVVGLDEEHPRLNLATEFSVRIASSSRRLKRNCDLLFLRYRSNGTF
jgi:hypothetical protein